MALTIFYLAAAVAVLLIGAGAFWVSWQAVQAIKQWQKVLAPQVELTLVEVQRNLNQIDELTQGVDTTVDEATQLVHSANNAVQTVGKSITTFNRKVAVPTLVRMRSAMEGVKAGVRHVRSGREREILVIEEQPEPAFLEEVEAVEAAEPIKP